MQHHKPLGLALVTILVAVVLVGATSAHATRLCMEKALAKCPAGQVWEEKTEVEAKLGSGNKSVFELGKFNEKGEFELAYKIECNESVLAGKTTNNGGGEGVSVLSEVTGLTNRNSKGNCPVSKELNTCSISSLGTPYSGAFDFESQGISEGKLRITEKGGGGIPRFQFSCLGGTVTCVYGKNVIALYIIGGAPWFIHASEEKLEKQAGSAGLCPAIAFWSAGYEGVKPAKMWVSKE